VRTPIVVAAAAALLSLASVPATAETWHDRDARHDVRSLVFTLDDLEDDPCGFGQSHPAPQDRTRDITRLAVDHGPDAVVVTVRFARLAGRREQTGIELGLRTGSSAFTVQVYRKPRGGPELQLLELDQVGYPESFGSCGGRALDMVECTGLTVDPDRHRDELAVTIPRSCLDDPQWVRAGARAFGLTKHSQTAWTVVYDTWGPHPDGRGLGILPPVGPKVRAG